MTYLDDIGPDDLLAAGLDFWQEPVVDFIAGPLRGHVVLGHVSLHQASDSLNVSLLHGSQTLCRCGLWERILADLILWLAARGQGTKAALVELLPVNRAVVVAAGGHGLGQDDAGSVQTLPDLVEVAASGDLLDEHGGEALAAKLLMYGKEVDLGAEDGLVADAQIYGDGRDVGDELARLGGADTDVVGFFPAGRHHGPI